MSFKAGETVGAYRIIEQLGQGGMATVFKAYHAALDRYVAIKVLHPAFMEDKNFLVRFQREARVVARLEHPNIVPIYDYAEHEGRPYLVMKYIEGETLKAHIVRGGMKPAEVTRIVEAVGAGLAYAHKQGILHRDIKPSNVILANDGNIYIADFGLARIAQSGESTMSSDMVLGTPQYISPEQAMGKRDLDAGTDIYSFGVMLYEMVVGQVPFSGDTPFAVIHDHIYSPLPLPTTANPNISAEVERVLLKALAKERADRYEDVTGLVDAFKLAWQNTAPTQATRMPETAAPAPSVPPSTPPAPVEATVAAATTVAPIPVEQKKKTNAWIWIGLVALLMLCGLMIVFVQIRRNRNQAASIQPTQAIAPATQPAAAPTQQPASTQPPAGLDPDAHLNLALDAWHNKDLARSMDEVKIAAELTADNNDFLIEAGTQLFDAGQFIGAATMYGHAAQNFKNSNQPLPPNVRDRLEQSFYFGAEMDGLPLYLPFDVIKTNDPALGLMTQTRYALLRGNIDIAHRSLDELIKTQPEWPVTKLVNAEILLKDGKLLEARRILVDLSNAAQAPDWVKAQVSRLMSSGGTVVAKTIKIVSSLPMTGASLTQTQTIINAMQLRLEQANSQVCGGKYTIAYEAWDDASAALGKWDPAVETENANKAAADKSIVAYLGTFNSGAAKLSIPILNQAGPLVMISPANTYAGLTKDASHGAEADEPDKYYPSGTRNYARVVAADDVQGAVDANFMFGQLGVKTVYILDDQELYGQGIADVFEVIARRLGMTVIGHEGIDPRAADYKALMTKISTSNHGRPPDGIFVGMVVDNNAAQLLKDKVAIMGDNTRVKFMGPDGIQTQAFIDGAGADVAEGVYASVAGLPFDKLNDAGRKFLRDYEARYGQLTEPYAIYGYEDMNVTLAALEKVCASGGDPSNRKQVRDAVFSIKDFNGVLGVWSFDANGDTTLTDMTVYIVRNGAYTAVGTFK